MSAGFWKPMRLCAHAATSPCDYKLVRFDFERQGRTPRSMKITPTIAD
jgi:hypothetical protein